MEDYIILLIAVAAVVLLYHNGTLRAISEALSIQNIMGYFGADLHPYKNMCLTKRPIGFPGSDNMNKYWKDRPKQWGVEYSDDRIRVDINKVRSSQSGKTKGSVPAPAQTLTVESKYYHNPVQYCKDHPDRYPCPNFWRADEKGHSDFKGHVQSKSDDMYVPGLVKGNFSHIKDSQIDDNYHVRIVDPHREDHGLCGNTEAQPPQFQLQGYPTSLPHQAAFTYL